MKYEVTGETKEGGACSRLLTSLFRALMQRRALHAMYRQKSEGEGGMYRGNCGILKPPCASCSQTDHFMNHTSSWRSHQHLEEPHVYHTFTYGPNTQPPFRCVFWIHNVIIIHKVIALDLYEPTFPCSDINVEMFLFLTCRAAVAVFISLLCQFSFPPALGADSFSMFLF